MRISKNQIKFIRSLSQKKVRDAEQLFLAEGEKCVRELLQSFEPYLIASSIPLLGVPALKASPMEIEQMSQLRHPQGVIAAFRIPNPIIAESADELTLALDGIQDPGNLGTIIRTADWFGISNIVCSADTVDCWNPKVVQATMGALARVRVQYTDLYSFIQRTTQSKADDAAGKCGSPELCCFYLALEAFSSIILVITSLRGDAPRSPSFLERRETVLSSTSLSPTMKK